MCRDKNTIELHIRSWNWEKGGSMWERCAVPWEDMKMVTSPNLPIFQSPISQLFDQASYISRSICVPKHAKSEHFFCCRIWISGWGEVWSNFRVLTINCRSEPPISIPRRPCCALWGALYSFVGRTLTLYKYGREWKKLAPAEQVKNLHRNFELTRFKRRALKFLWEPLKRETN